MHTHAHTHTLEWSQDTMVSTPVIWKDSTVLLQA